MSVWKELTEMGIRVVCRNPNFQNINEDGKTDIFSQLMISILSTMSEFERKMIKERQMEGINLRKVKGLYSERQVGTIETPEKFLQKPKNQKIVKDLENGFTVREIMEMRKASPSTILKMKELKLKVSKN